MVSAIRYGAMVALLLVQGVFAQVTVHVLNPWRNDTCAGHRDTLLMQGDPGAGLNWSPGEPMSSEGGGWFFYIFPKPNFYVARVATYCGPETWQGWTEYQLDFNLDTIFSRFSASTKDIWILIADSSSRMTITDKSPIGGKFIYLLNPWPIGTPQVLIEGFGAPRMHMDTSITRCGWFKYPYYGDSDSARVKFMNSLDSTLYSGTGIGDGPYIDLSTVFKVSDTAWVLPTPYPSGAATLHASYPGQSVPCNRTLELATTIRDWDSTHPDFGGFWEQGKNATNTGCWQQGDWGAPIPGMVQRQLDANGRMVLSATSPCGVDNFNWFTTETITGQYTNARCSNLTLKKNDEGLYEYDTGYFFAADSFLYLDDGRTVPNPRYGGGNDGNDNPHNFYYTMELSAQFEYHKGQTFYFRGDDDVWVFINNRLVVDLGGIHNPMEGSVKLDTLGLTVGNTYGFKLFFCERNLPGSSFRMLTSLNLRTSSKLFSTVTVVSPSSKRFDLFEKISKNNLSCDQGETIIDTEKAIVDFYIEGPPFPATPPTALTVGTSYGGITIVDNSAVILDTAVMTGLPAGKYLIRYRLTSDHSQGGTIPFTVTAPPPHHVDILVDAVPLDIKKDAAVDSIVIGMFDTNAEAFAVIRSIDQIYQHPATDPVWTVRDSTVATVTRSPTIPSRCVITKVNSGQTWLVVNHAPGLKPDSVLVITYVQPPYPVIVSGIMADDNADLVPDMLRLTLSDSFKTDQQPDSVQIDFRGVSITIPRERMAVQGTFLNVSLPGNLGVNARPKGSATLFITVGGEVESSTRAYTDGVAPAIIAADVLENDDSGSDVLFLTFSEPVATATIIGRQLLLIRQGSTDTVEQTVTQILAQVSDSTYTVQVIASEPAGNVAAGDRLRLIPGSAGGTLSDLSGNRAHDLNRSVVVGFKPGAASIAAAWYLDVNADGSIDQVQMKFVRKVALSEICAIGVQRNAGLFRIPVAQCTRLSDSLCMIDIGDSIARLGSSISTRGIMNLSVEYCAFPGVLRTSTVDDSAAPVIVSADLHPGSLTTTGERGNDVLVVTFSEGVLQFGPSPFLLSAKKDGQLYRFTLEYLGENVAVAFSYRFLVRSINTSLPFASAGDTIWIDPAAHVADSGGVDQSNPLNRRVLLKVDWPAAEWKIKISANPFGPETPLPGETFGGGVGIGILLVPTTPVDETRIRAAMTIYDKVGNVVYQSDFTPFNRGFRAVWSGENRKGRYVGNGTYIAYVKVNDGSGNDFMQTVKIGFKR